MNAPSDTYARMAEHACQLDSDDPTAADAMAVLLDLAMNEGLTLELPSIRAYPGARPSPALTINATMIAEIFARTT